MGWSPRRRRSGQSRTGQSVEDWSVPRDIGELRGFVGLVSYYRSFVPNFSVIAAPLFNLTKKAVPFSSSAECQTAFETLRKRLASAHVLATPEMAAAMW